MDFNNHPYPYAAGYYPLMHSRSDWKRDLMEMKRCNIKVIRTAELFNSWDQLEPLEGDYRFELLDEFFDECQKMDMQILLGTGTASPPYWLHQKEPEVNILSSNGRRYPNNVSYSWACFHNPVYLEACDRYIRTLVLHYKNHPALYAYQIHNEIGLPFMPLKDGEMEMYCYCEHSKKAFRRWLKDKYQTLEELNQAWTWSATNTYHTSWDMVEPPYTKPVAWSSVTRYLDFRLFMMDSITSFVRWQNTLIKELDEQHPTATNIFFMKGEDKMSVMTAIDQFSLAREVDVIGYDLYPGSGNKLETRPEFVSMFLDHARSISQPLNKRYWLMELESGPINGWALGPHRNTSHHDIRRYVLDALAYDAKMILYQGYRQWDFQPLCWGGLVDLDGMPTKRTEAAAGMGAFIQKNSTFLQTAKTKKGEAAILLSKENAILANGMGHEEFLIMALRGAYRVLWEMGFTIDFLTPELLQEGYGAGYAILILPFHLMCTKEMAGAIKEYAGKGGIVVGFPRLGYVEERGWYNHQWPPYELQEVFGVKSLSLESGGNYKITYEYKEYHGFWHKEQLELISKQAEVLAAFYDDNPAVIRNCVGKGTGLYFATHAENGYVEKQDYLLWDILRKTLSEHGIRPKLEILYSDRENHEINGRILYGQEMDMVILTVYLREGRDSFFKKHGKKIQVLIEDEEAVYQVKSAYSGEVVPSSRKGRRLLIDYMLQENEYPVWYLMKTGGESHE